MSEGSSQQSHGRHLVLALFWVANPAYLLFDLVRLHPVPLAVIAGRSLAEVALVGAWLWLRRHPAANPFSLLRATCCAAAGVWVLITAGAGGTSSAYFAMLPAMPLVYVASYPEDPVGALLVGASDLIGGLALLGMEHAAAARMVEWASVAVFLGGAGYLAGVLARARTRRELANETSRREAVERLAVSERRRAAAERLAGIGQLAAGVAHEINNPLSYVRSNVHALVQEAPDPESRQLFEDTLSGLARIAQIVADLGVFARDHSDTAEQCDPGAVVEEAIRLATFRIQRRASVLRALEVSGGPPLFVPRRRLVQALVNLLVNAADAVEECPGHASDRPPTIRISARHRDGAVHFEVEDNGPGPSAAAREHLFEPFFTTKGPRGTGLGLAISKENVERCGGTLELRHGREGGALFAIRIPVEPRPEAAREGGPAPSVTAAGVPAGPVPPRRGS